MKRKSARTFQDLMVWQRAHQFVLSVYRSTTRFPRGEVWGLTSQLRRAAISIPVNIAEEFKNMDRSEKNRFMIIAQDSVEQCRYYLILAKDLGYTDTSELISQLEEVNTLLDGYARSILLMTPDF
jgi:four helix bundle protein